MFYVTILEMGYIGEGSISDYLNMLDMQPLRNDRTMMLTRWHIEWSTAVLTPVKLLCNHCSSCKIGEWE